MNNDPFLILAYQVTVFGRSDRVSVCKATVVVERRADGEKKMVEATDSEPARALGVALFKALRKLFKNLNPINTQGQANFNAALRQLANGFKEQVLNNQ